MATADTRALIEMAVERIMGEVHSLQQLKLIIGLELRGRGDVQLYRVQLPGPDVTKDIASDARVRVSIPRSHFNELAREGNLKLWRQAFETGTAKAEGPPEILRLIQTVVARQEERNRTKRARH